MLTLIKTRGIANVTSKRWHPGPRNEQKWKALITQSVSTLVCSHHSLSAAWTSCIILYTGLIQKLYYSQMDFVIKMPIQDSGERNSKETETGMKTRWQQATRSLRGRAEGKSGLSLQVYLKGAVIRLNFRGLSWEISSWVLFFYLLFYF